jgi:hypothetical protein
MHSFSGETTVLEGVHCTMTISRPAEAVILVHIAGLDAGELGQRPFAALVQLLERGKLSELFIDARAARGPSVDVSALWAGWLREHRAHFEHINMLTRSRFVQLTADFVQRFSGLGDRMRIFTDPAAFDTALELASAR